MGKVFVFCEYSDVVGSAFRAEGHDVTSCDLLPSEGSPNHYQGDGRHLLREPWDLVIAHPPCNVPDSTITWAGSNAAHAEGIRQGRRVGGRCLRPLTFSMDCSAANAPLVAVENPPARFMQSCQKDYWRAKSAQPTFGISAAMFGRTVGWWLKACRL